MKRKICFFTGTRAEFGLMSSFMHRVDESDDCQLQIIATNMHLSPEYGLTYKEIEAEGFTIDKKVEMLLSSDTANGTVKSMGLATIGFADALEDLKPDLCVILGDRYEMLAAAQSALIYKIPVVHLGGGDITEGAYDDAIRHSITKMSHIHFTSTEECRNRIIQMGENPENVYCVGGGVSSKNISKNDHLSKEELEKSLDFELGDKFLLITFHPVTMEGDSTEQQCADMLKALEEVNEEYKLLFTLPNSDTGGRVIISMINEFVKDNRQRRYSIPSLGRKRYFAALKYATAVIGNSSSGLIEVPSFHIPTLNIGNRQRGRAHGESVLDVAANYESIKNGLKEILSTEFVERAKNAKNPYENEKESGLDKKMDVITHISLETLIPKKFFNIR